MAIAEAPKMMQNQEINVPRIGFSCVDEGVSMVDPNVWLRGGL